jgi:hypothetical protein
MEISLEKHTVDLFKVLDTWTVLCSYIWADWVVKTTMSRGEGSCTLGAVVQQARWHFLNMLCKIERKITHRLVGYFERKSYGMPSAPQHSSPTTLTMHMYEFIERRWHTQNSECFLPALVAERKKRVHFMSIRADDHPVSQPSDRHRMVEIESCHF